jgi:hypothetical protein
MTLLVTFMTYDVEPSPSSDKQQTELAIPNCHRFSRLPLHIHDIQGQTVVSQKTLSRFCWPVRSHSWLRYPDMIWLILIGCMWCNRRANTEICIIWYHMYIYLMLFVYIYVDICRICIICTIFVYAIYVHMRMILFNTHIYSGIIHPSQSPWAAKDHSSPAATGEAGVSGVRQWRSEMPGRLFQ